ncbi:UDP-glycosyltransferase 83A1-like [Henckelia pumila]|uniref:UDP-glycosyltransferase 83A1-like n=1 Tax=Henckelia pumila TaxID=405737 RepID=UPI003C6DCA70
MGKPHVIAIPYPAQGHVIPLMEVALCLAENGVQVTFVNTEFIHERVMKALPEAGNIHELMNLVTIPDGLEPLDDRSDLGKLGDAMYKTMPGNLEILINNIHGIESGERTCVLSDYYMGWALEVAEKLGLKKALFLPASVAMMALTSNAQKLLDDGIIDKDGTPLTQQVIQLSPGMPELSIMNLPWAMVLDLTTQKIIFQAILENNESTKLAEWLICNTFNELEPAALSFIPRCFPVGPLISSNRLGKQAGYFWPEDSSCLQWLDRQPPRSVVYVAFGSFTVFDQTQFKELALGLELSNRPFLWVVRQDITQDIHTAYPEGFEERVKNLGKMVGWAPQQKVLSHPSVACFLSHCGWNSTIEGLSNGIPFLCWPYFADQFLNKNYICDLWKVGLGFNKDDNGIIKQEEIKNKVEQLLTDEGYKARTLELQAKAIASVADGGCSQKNFNKLVEWIKEN